MSKAFTFETTIVRGLEEYEITADYEVGSWGSPGSYWEPPEGMELWIVRATITPPAWAKERYPYGMPFCLTDAEAERIEAAICMDPPEPDGPDPDDWRDEQWEREHDRPLWIEDDQL